MKFHFVLISIILFITTNAFKSSSNLKYQYTTVRSTKLNAKPNFNQPSIADKVSKYIKMKELRKLRSEGGTYDDIKEFVINGTAKAELISAQESFNPLSSPVAKKGYQKLVGKGNLDQRLRAIIAYKRSSIASESLASEKSETGLSVDEEAELEQMMNEEDGNSDAQDELEDDEEAEYESLVMKAIEENKLNELKRNFLLDKNIRNDQDEDNDEKQVDIKSISSNVTSLTSNNDKVNVSADDDLYTPARSSWGVFQRPRDISRTFGGGRSITKEEMDRMDREYEEEQQRSEWETKQTIYNINKKENDNSDKIKSALNRARAYLGLGNRKSAVEQLESVQEFVSWQTDLGGQVQLEYAMALETVDRGEESRQIYAKLSVVSWSQKIRSQATQLLQGLEITKQIRKDTGPKKPFMDVASMKLVSDALKPGLTNEWDQYSSKKYYKVSKWFDDGSNILRQESKIVVESISDAYNLLSRMIDPLFQVPSQTLRLAFRRLLIAVDAEKVGLLRSRGIVATTGPSTRSSAVGSLPITSSISNGTKTSATFQSVISTITGGLNPESSDQYTSSAVYFTGAAAKKSSPIVRINNSSQDLSDIYLNSLNGTWELVVSLSAESAKDGAVTSKRYDYAELRRDLLLSGPNDDSKVCVEVFPTLFGFATARSAHALKPSTSSEGSSRLELVLSGPQVRTSPAPWQLRRQETQSFEVVYCDDAIKVTRQARAITEPEVFTLWKRVLPTVWKKY